jgi:hypothetical protein
VVGPNRGGLGAILGSIGLEHRWMALSSRAKRMYQTLREITSDKCKISFEACFGFKLILYT